MDEAKVNEAKCLCIYHESLRQHLENVNDHGINKDGLNSWQGTQFQAATIAEKFIFHQLNRTEVDVLRAKAKARFNRLLIMYHARNQSDELIGFSNTVNCKRRIFSDEIIQRAIQKGLQPKLK